MIGQLVFGTLLQFLYTMFQNLGGDAAKTQFDHLLNQKTLKRRVIAAINRAYQRFVSEVHDPELLTAIEHTHLETDPHLVEILTQVAAEPYNHEHHLKDLTDLFVAIAPQCGRPRCQQAARLLLNAVHAEISTIPGLHDAILALRHEQLRKDLDKLRAVPPYVAGLREALTQDATALVSELCQGYVTASHLLYALACQPTSLAGRLLRQCGVSVGDIQEKIKACIKPYDGPVRDAMTANATQILSTAQEMARDGWAAQTRDDHVLLAVLNQVQESASLKRVLELLHLDVNQLADAASRQGQITTALNSIESISE